MPAVAPQPARPAHGGMRVFAVSDLHTDYAENLAWVEALSPSAYRGDAIIVAGDVTDGLERLEATLALLTARFSHVFFTPGNHDLWCRHEGEPRDSLAKLAAVLDLCAKLRVDTAPRRIGDVWIVPIFSWHHQSFDKEPDIEDFVIPPLEKVSMDYKVCRWPEPLSNADDTLARHFDRMNDAPFANATSIGLDSCQIISFSHFLPRLELCPEKRMLFYPNLPKVVGSDWLERRVRGLHGVAGSPTAIHIFGHTHFCWDAMLEGIRYIQAPLAYPKERQRRVNGGVEWLPLCVYDSASDGAVLGGPLDCHWSRYYAENARTPHITELAPWVADLYKAAPTAGHGVAAV
eukprot:SM000064S19820  [mRNA]  locus=s64:536002:538047:- [translate_table: standard]